MQIGIAIFAIICIVIFRDWTRYSDEKKIILMVTQEYVQHGKRKSFTTCFGEGEYSIGTGLQKDMRIKTAEKLELLVEIEKKGGMNCQVLKGEVYYKGQKISEGAPAIYVKTKENLKTKDGTMIYVDAYRRREKER